MFSRLNFVLYNKTHKPTEISVGLFLCTYSGTHKKFSDTHKKVSNTTKSSQTRIKRSQSSYALRPLVLSYEITYATATLRTVTRTVPAATMTARMMKREVEASPVLALPEEPPVDTPETPPEPGDMTSVDTEHEPSGP